MRDTPRTDRACVMALNAKDARDHGALGGVVDDWIPAALARTLERELAALCSAARAVYDAECALGRFGDDPAGSDYQDARMALAMALDDLGPMLARGRPFERRMTNPHTCPDCKTWGIKSCRIHREGQP